MFVLLQLFYACPVLTDLSRESSQIRFRKNCLSVQIIYRYDLYTFAI